MFLNVILFQARKVYVLKTGSKISSLCFTSSSYNAYICIIIMDYTNLIAKYGTAGECIRFFSNANLIETV